MPFAIKGNDVIAFATGGALEEVWVPENRDDMESIMLLNSPSSVIAEYIIEILQTFTEPNTKNNWPLWIGHLPGGDRVKDDAASIKDTPGLLDGRSMRSGQVFQHFGLQIKLRSNDYEEGWKKLEELATNLDAVSAGTTIIKDGTTYTIQNLSRSTPVVNLGREKDKKRRNIFTVNYLLTIREEI